MKILGLEDALLSRGEASILGLREVMESELELVVLGREFESLGELDLGEPALDLFLAPGGRLGIEDAALRPLGAEAAGPAPADPGLCSLEHASGGRPAPGGTGHRQAHRSPGHRPAFDSFGPHPE